jgi:hypothetical protein
MGAGVTDRAEHTIHIENRNPLTASFDRDRFTWGDILRCSHFREFSHRIFSFRLLP